jgi:uncharacterized protein YggE
MKHSLILFTAVGAGFMILSSCNNQRTEQTKERTIEVTGSAEKEVTPDEVYFSITLTEYKKGNKKITMDDLEGNLMRKAMAIGVRKQDVQFENMYSYSYYYDYWYNHKRYDYYSSKTFTVKLNKPEMIDKLLVGGDSLNYTAVHISRFSNSKKAIYRDSLKIEALKAAHSKAEMLLTSIGEKIGEVISITEVVPAENTGYGYGYWGYCTTMNEESNVVSGSREARPGGNASFKDMKLRYEIKAVFRINSGG